MHINHPHWYYHYRELGALFTACGRDITERGLNTTHELAKVTCRWCIQTDSFLAANTERVILLLQEGPALLDTHFMNGATRKTPCESAYLHGAKVVLSTKEVTCPVCAGHPIYLDALAAETENALSVEKAERNRR